MHTTAYNTQVCRLFQNPPITCVSQIKSDLFSLTSVTSREGATPKQAKPIKLDKYVSTITRYNKDKDKDKFTLVLRNYKKSY